MGMFADYRSVSKQAKAMQKTSDVKGSLSTMQSKMEALNASMTPSSPGLAATHGIACPATITSSRQTGALINFMPACEIELLVMIPGRPPHSVSCTEVVPPLYLSRALPGQAVNVRVMADNPDDLFIDWTATSA